MPAKFVFLTVGALQGKGIVAASLGRLLKSRGVNVGMIRFAPFFNTDAGSLGASHGEVFVTRDGAMCSQEIGYYERFLNGEMLGVCERFAGAIYKKVIEDGEKGRYRDDAIRSSPHITAEIKRSISEMVDMFQPDIALVEIEGEIGGTESLPFIEAMRQTYTEMGRQNCAHIHVTLAPYLRKTDQVTTDMAEHHAKQLRAMGLEADIVICLSEGVIGREVKDSIALGFNLRADRIVVCPDVDWVYELPLRLEEGQLSSLVCRKLKLGAPQADMDFWAGMVGRRAAPLSELNIALVGQYFDIPYAYRSVIEALEHAGIQDRINVRVCPVDSGQITDLNAEQQLARYDGIVAPDVRCDDFSGLTAAAQFSRGQHMPYFGIGMGMCALLPGAPMITGAELKRGLFHIPLEEDGLLRRAYGGAGATERHYQKSSLHPDCRDKLIGQGLRPTFSSDGAIEALEDKRAEWVIGVLFRPEFSSRPEKPHPLFRSFIKACCARAKNVNQIEMKLE